MKNATEAMAKDQLVERPATRLHAGTRETQSNGHTD